MNEATAVEDELKKHPAAASDKEVLALEPNKANPEGPHPQINPNTYVTWTKPDGSSFVAPVANSDTYERKGFKRGAEQDIPDMVAYQAELASKEPKTEVAEHKAPAKASSA